MPYWRSKVKDNCRRHLDVIGLLSEVKTLQYNYFNEGYSFRQGVQIAVEKKKKVNKTNNSENTLLPVKQTQPNNSIFLYNDMYNYFNIHSIGVDNPRGTNRADLRSISYLTSEPAS